MRDLLNEVIDTLQEKFPVNRVVALLTPLYAAGAAAIATYATQKLPFIADLVPNAEAVILAEFVSLSLIAGAQAYKWLDGWQKAEDRGDV